MLVLSCQSASISRNNISSTENSGKKDNGESAPSRSVNTSDQKSLKVRIRVGSDNALARNNAAIYSGLGLDISPSSSLDDSAEGSGELSPDFGDMDDESPRTILEVNLRHLLVPPLI